MARIQTILVPVDGSLPSLTALRHALDLADSLGASIDVLHVSTGGPAPADTDEARDLDRALQAAETRIPGRLRRRMESGDPGRTILELAAREGFGLIVMGTHGRVGRLHSLVGSIAEEVVRNAPCPVLTVRAPDGAEESFSERIHRTASVADQIRPR